MRANRVFLSFFCSIVLYKLYKIMFPSFADGEICSFDWILKAKLFQIPQDDFVRFEGASTVATTTKKMMQHRFSFFFFVENNQKTQQKKRESQEQLDF